MMKKLFSICCALLFLFVTGCASTLEDANKGAEEGGKPAGKVLSIPNSFSKGVAEGVAGEPESNPYSR